MAKKTKKSAHKPKTTVNTPEVTEIKEEVIEVVEKVVDDSKKATEKAEKKMTKEVLKVEKKIKESKNPFKGFFARKYPEGENILTIFETPRIWGAVIGEVIGTMFLSMLLLTLGIQQPLYILFGFLAITLAVFAYSGAHLNPATTIGMMVTRRVSAIRGVLYIVAQVVGAWLGLLIIGGLRTASGASAELPALTAATGSDFWKYMLIEFVGVFTVAFFFNRAQEYNHKKSAFTYAAIIAGGVTLAVLFCLILSDSFFKLRNNFILNPAIAIMYQIFPTSAEKFDALMGTVALESLVHIITPLVAGILAFFVADVAKALSDDCECECCEEKHHDKCCK